MASWLAREELRGAGHTDRDPEQTPLIAIGNVHHLAREPAEIAPPFDVGNPGGRQLHQELDFSRRRYAPDVSEDVLGGIHVAANVDAHAVDTSRAAAAPVADAAVALTGAEQRILAAGAFFRPD